MRAADTDALVRSLAVAAKQRGGPLGLAIAGSGGEPVMSCGVEAAEDIPLPHGSRPASSWRQPPKAPHCHPPRSSLLP